ncbi:MAG: hypothetical protein EAZ20_14435, partial [Bacteroidetes bacterium]
MKKISISKDMLWKGIIEDLFFEFLEYFFDDWAKEHVDFNIEPVFLNDELEKIYEKTKEGGRSADKLVKVFLKNGKEQYLFLHIEIQGYEDSLFPYRMFVSFYRILDNLVQKDTNKGFKITDIPKIMAFAIYTDEVPDFKPIEFKYDCFETTLNYNFKTFKILDKNIDELNINNNIFSYVVQAVRYAVDKNKKTDLSQLEWKFDLMERLTKAGYDNRKKQLVWYFIKNYIGFKAKEYSKKLENKINKKPKSMTLTEMIIQEAKAEGREEGEAKGIEKG